MANYEDGSYSSAPGIALIAKALAGRCQMKYTRAAVGSGTIPEGESPKTMKEPPDYVMDAKISAVTNPVGGECQVTVQINSSDVERGFYATSILLYAEDPDEGEIPYTYLVLENEPEWIRPSSSVVGKLATFDLIAAVGEVDAVTAVIDTEVIPTIGYVDKMLAEHNADPHAHGGTGGVKAIEITIPADGWVQAADGDGYAADVSDAAVKEEAYPLVSLHETSFEAAQQAGVSSVVQALDGVLRFRAAEKPDRAIAATAVLLFSSGTAGVGGGSTVPKASDTALGCVRVQRGSGLTVDADGNLAVDSGLKSDIEAIFQK